MNKLGNLCFANYRDRSRKAHLYILRLAAVFYLCIHFTYAQNPIVKGKGLCDPAVRIYNDRVYLYATHDASPDNEFFRMYNWWIWSSSDLVNWKYESTLRPQDTFYGKPDSSCWATDAISKNGKYYFYFSRGRSEIGVVVSDTPVGPWKDPLGKPLIPSDLTPTQERDPAVFLDDDGQAYVVFGVFDYYIARLNEDMISLSEKPRLIELDQKMGPYGRGKTDDKPYLHKRNGIYYLSWGCYYAMSDKVYGPYQYKSSVIVKERTAKEFQDSLTYDRHGSFFELYNQWYFICNDQSFPGSSHFFRNSVISYVHYRANGEIEPVCIDQVGVGQYDAGSPVLEAENYFKAMGVTKQEFANGKFEIRDIQSGDYLVYPNILNCRARRLSFCLASGNPGKGTIEIREKGIDGKLLGRCRVSNTGGWSAYKIFTCTFKNEKKEKLDICLVFRGAEDKELMRLDWFHFE